MASVDELAARVRAARRTVDRSIGEAAAVAREGQRLTAEVAQLKSEQELYARTTTALTSVGEKSQDDAQRVVEQLVTRGLQMIFGEELSFYVKQVVRSNRAEVDFVVRSVYGDRVVETPVMDARGGGLAQVIAFILRVVVLLLTPRKVRRWMVLDESFGMLSAEFEVRLAEFIRALCDSADMQVFLVTHSDAFYQAADVRYRLELGVDGYTHVREQ